MVWVNTWSDADDETLIQKRDVECKHMRTIANEMGRALRTCYGRYAKLVFLRKAIEPVELVPAPMPRRHLSPHEQLGIATFVHRQAVLAEPDGGRGKKSEYGFGYDRINRVWSNSHLFRASVTLPKVFA